jgi:hypothetical protein
MLAGARPSTGFGADANLVIVKRLPGGSESTTIRANNFRSIEGTEGV